jgi:NitT/TauT family transport system permease protein
MTARTCPLSDVWRRRISCLLFLTALLALWQGICLLGIWDETLLPAPLQVWQAFAAAVRDGSMTAGILASMKRLFVGYGLSLAIGIPLGLLLGRNRLLDDTAGSLAVGLQALPSICWLPLAVLWFGLSETAMQFVVVMGSFMSVTLAVRDGVKAIPPLYIRASRVLGARGWFFYRHVLLPASMPALLTGTKLGWSFAWRSLMLYGSIGIGSTLMSGRELHDMALVVAAMLVIVAIGLLFDRVLFQAGERYIQRRWGV